MEIGRCLSEENWCAELIVEALWSCDGERPVHILQAPGETLVRVWVWVRGSKARGILFVPSTFCFVRACPISLLVVLTRRYAPDDNVHAVINVKEPIAVTANYATKSNLEQHGRATAALLWLYVERAAKENPEGRGKVLSIPIRDLS